MIIKVKISDTNIPDWMILPETNKHGGGICYVAGANAFVYIPDEDYPETIFNIPAQPIGIPDGIPPNATMLIGTIMADAWGLPQRLQVGKTRMEDNHR